MDRARRALQAEVARSMTDEMRRGMTIHTGRQRTIVVSFDTVAEAEAWDRLPEDEAFMLLAAAAASRRAERERAS